MSSTDSVRVIVVDGSAAVRGIWKRLLEAEKGFIVTASASTGRHAIQHLEREEFQLAIVDIEMPDLDGFALVSLMLAKQPWLRVIGTGTLSADVSTHAVRALTAGAADFVSKPPSLNQGCGVEIAREELIPKAKALARERSSAKRSLEVLRATVASSGPDAVVIGASTGGPQAVVSVLSRIRPEIQQPIIIVQHILSAILPAFVELISRESRRPCVEATEGEKILDGRIYVAPGNQHLTLAREGAEVIARLNRQPPECFSRPSVNPLLRSAAAIYRERLLAVILTGLGEDGKDGCLEVARLGGNVVVQDESTSVIWGMPGAVVQSGAATEILPIHLIGPRISDLCMSKETRSHAA